MHRWNASCQVKLHLILVYTTQVNNTFRARWLASSEVINQVLSTSEQLKKNKMTFVGLLSQIELLFEPPVIQLVWYILKQLFTSVPVKVVRSILLHSLHFVYQQIPPYKTDVSTLTAGQSYILCKFSCIILGVLRMYSVTNRTHSVRRNVLYPFCARKCHECESGTNRAP